MSRAMKDSGVEWIGEIPEDWDTIKMRNIGVFSASGIDKLINPGEPLVRIINYTDVYGNKTLLLDDKDYMVVSANEDKIKNHVVEEGDLIFTPSSETIEDIGISALVNKSLPNTAFSYHVLRFQFNRDVFKSYKKYLCNNHYVQNVFSSRATGSIRKTLNRADFKDLTVILPPVEEQQKIANFLDQKVAEIDHILEKTKESIEEYKKYKQSIITEAVTKGLNPDVEMKDSGIDWIGEIPKHWKITKTKHVTTKITDGAHVSPDTNNGVYDFISTVNIKIDKIDFDDCLKTSEDSYFQLVNNGCKPLFGDVLISKDGTVGKTVVVDFEKDFVVASSLVIMRPLAIINPFYLNYVLKSYFVQEQLNSFMKGTGLKRVSVANNGNLLITIPSKDEQVDIICYLDNKCTEIDNLISQKETLLKDLELYKKSLIYECVTGKREVM